MCDRKLPPGRLPSFRSARDLTLGVASTSKLGDKVRKVYTPNLNVQRNKYKDDTNPKDESVRGRNRQGLGRSQRRSDRGHSTNRLIQITGGVFSEGSAVSGGASGSGGVRYSLNITKSGTSSSTLQIPKLNLQQELKVDKELEERKLRELLQDDFVDDPGLDPDESCKPIQLPFHKEDVSDKKEAKTEEKIISEEIVIDGVKIKQEPVEECVKTLKEMKMKVKPDRQDCDESEQNVGNFFKNKHQIFFLQLPDTLPGLKSGTSAGSSKPSTSKANPCQNPEDAANEKCTLGSLSEGCIGKLQLLKSGRVQLVLNNNMVMHVSSSLQLGCREELVSVDVDPSKRSGDMINLGQVEARLLCTPHWESMLPKHNS